MIKPNLETDDNVLYWLSYISNSYHYSKTLFSLISSWL